MTAGNRRSHRRQDDALGIVIMLAAAVALVAAAAAAAMMFTDGDEVMQRAGALVAFAAALISAYAAYELVLFAATPFLGGAGDFTSAIVGRLGGLSALWLIGLIAACEVSRLFNAARRRQTAS